MHERFERRIEEGLAKVTAACARSRQQAGTIERRVGRLLGQNSRAAGLFDIRIRADERGAAQIEWTKVERWRTWSQLSEGAYVLRTNVRDWSDEELRRAYTQLTDAEAAFRIQKSDLSLRPVWHQKQDRVLAELAELRTVDVVLPTKAGPEIRTRCITQPSEHQKILIQHLGLTVLRHLRKSDR
jgi:hypothetical protein